MTAPGTTAGTVEIWHLNNMVSRSSTTAPSTVHSSATPSVQDDCGRWGWIVAFS